MKLLLAKKLIVATDASIAETQEKFAQEAKELEDTQKQLAMDVEFLRNLKEKCATMDADYDKRVKDRLTEIDAVEDTIRILNNDESFKAFDKQVAPNPMFMQIAAASTEKLRRQQAVSVLQRAASMSGASPQIALIAASAQLDAFTKVKELIDKMIAELATQQKDEVAHRDWCIDELNSNKRSTAAAYDKKTNLQTKIADLEKSIEHLTKDIDASKAAIKEMEIQMKRASETREAE